MLRAKIVESHTDLGLERDLNKVLETLGDQVVKVSYQMSSNQRYSAMVLYNHTMTYGDVMRQVEDKGLLYAH
ncbi:hypothetical protein [Bacillus cereus]|uniref:Uncharacterized protein n=1 Tax=Bacillus cereus HuA3-9 TaxID=1053205 RepID=R8CIF5_BACCE|nr:hypothetical protein [Bacillus cereus]EOO11372.1 hypothetical protein IGA_05635 [Bacillus cereus HuA3-9]